MAVKRFSSGHPATRSPRLEYCARQLAFAALALIAIKPLLDILTEEPAGDVVDLGVIVSVVGALLVVAALVSTVLAARRLPPRSLGLMMLALVLMLVLSGISLLAVSARDELLALFDVRRSAIYGPYLAPQSGIATEAMRLIVSFAPVLLVGIMLLRPDWFPVRRLVLVAGVILAGAILHSLIAWLQVFEVVPYSFYFELPGQKIGRASGGYYHPMSLGRLLIFSVFMIYVLDNRLHLPVLGRYALIGLFVATAGISLHRLTIVCLIVIVVAFEARRLRTLLAAARSGRVNKRLALGVTGVVAAAVALISTVWGATIWERGKIAVTEVGSLNIRSDTFMHGRGAIWNDVADIFGRASWDIWLFGFGYEPWDMHNDLLRLGVVWGVTGVLLTVFFLWSFYRLVWRHSSGIGRWQLIVLFLTLLLFGLTQKPMSYPYFMWLFFFCAMLIISITVEAKTVEAGTAAKLVEGGRV